MLPPGPRSRLLTIWRYTRDPTAFRPERHLEASFGPTELMPFGGGHRRCIGAAFAVYELKLVLATLLADHGLSLVRGEPVRLGLRNISLGPTSPILAVRA